MSELQVQRVGRWLRRFSFHALALSFSLVFVVIFIWVLSYSLRKPGLPPPRTIEWVPNPVSFNNYVKIFDLAPFAQFALNSLIVAGLAVPITVTAASWAGFGMSQVGPRLQRALVVMSILLLMVPITALWLTRYILFTNVGIVDTFLALLAPAFMGTVPFFILLYYWSFRRIPHELFEAALMDGANAFQMWWGIALPVTRPTTVTVSVLTFALYWSDFINPLLYMKTESRYTLAVGLSYLQQLDKTNWPLLMAAAVMITVPVIVLFLVVQRYFWPESQISGLGGR
jgi:multiple sugar transport system permease protein